ncbi:CPBP family intramembrane metalloprotease [Clostridiaceae bacterium OttesenSCG-928-D20]|nr:CPBP family intramembrane metalloprotease [Clostridiaceae bacterium OttesenSCG-928-D20]
MEIKIVNNRCKTVVIVILTLIMTFMEMSALPAALFFDIKIMDINPICITLLLNFIIAFAICWLCKKFFIEDWQFGLQLKGTLDGLRKYGLPAVIATAIVTIAFWIGLMPFDNKPTIWKVVVEGVVYYIGVAIMEELYLRGLLQNIIEKWFGERKNATLYAILIASVLFGLGHIWGALGQPIVTVICKTIWATALGIYFGAVYVKSKNLWVPIILHLIINLCGIPFCFSTSNQYPAIAVVACLISYISLGIYGLYILRKKD